MREGGTKKSKSVLPPSSIKWNSRLVRDRGLAMND